MSDSPSPSNGADLAAFAGSTQKAGKPNAAQQLLALADDLFDVVVDGSDKVYGIRKGGHVAYPLRGSKRSIRAQLAGLFYDMTGRTASSNALTEATDVLEIKATRTDPVTLALRVARPADDEVWVDLGGVAEEVARITPAGWEILSGTASDVPVTFKRTALTLPIPAPVSGGDMDLLWDFVNAPGMADRHLLTGWLVSALTLATQPVPVLALLGEQGSAKTSALGRLFSLFDPTKGEPRLPPKDPHKFVHSLHGSRGTKFDNLSGITRPISDILCMAVTGGSDVDRALYTDDDLRLLHIRGVVGFTGISVGAISGDLAERTVWLDLERITPAARRSERDLEAAWAQEYPQLVGALFDLVAQVLGALPQVSLTEKPRMADFAEILAAQDLARGTTSLEHYLALQADFAEELVGADPFLSAVTKKVVRRWEGTSKALHALLTPPDGGGEYWPSVRGMPGKLRRVAPDLRAAGWVVEQVTPDPASKRPKTWVLIPPSPSSVGGHSDAELDEVVFAHEMSRVRFDVWRQRVLADGATPECATDHARDFRLGETKNGCHVASCTAAWRPEYRVVMAGSKAADDYYHGLLRALGLKWSQVNEIVAKRAETTS